MTSTSTQHQHAAPRSTAVAGAAVAGAADEAGRTGQPPSPRVTLSVPGRADPLRDEYLREAGTRSDHSL